MLYTVMPLERVYFDFLEKQRESNLNKQETGKMENSQQDDYQEVLLPHGRVVTRRNGKDYVVERVYSTDMSDYLNDEYSPGKTVKKR